MRLPKLFSVAFAVAAFLFASASFAASRICNGVIEDETVLVDIEVLTNQTCIINESTVFGAIFVDGANTVIINNSDIEKEIFIKNAETVGINGVTVDDGNIVVIEGDVVSLRDNITNDGNIRVENNVKAHVTRNDAEGRIDCTNNTSLRSSFNTAGPGGDRCPPKRGPGR